MTEDQKMDRFLEALQEGERAARELRDAMKLTGVLFPSLISGFPACGMARVELGGMGAEAALQLAAWIREHA